MRLRLKRPGPPGGPKSTTDDDGEMSGGSHLGQRDFLKLIGAAVGVGLVGQLVAPPTPALANTLLTPNVGIGTSTPGYALEIVQNNAPQLALRGSWSGGAGYLRFQEANPQPGFWDVITRNANPSQVGNMDWTANPDGSTSPSHYHYYMTFVANNSLDTSSGMVSFPGSVGIGTSGPQYPLDVYGYQGSGWTQGTLRLNGLGSDVMLHVVNSSTGGRDYALDSTGNASGIGGGKFLINDTAAQAIRLAIDSSGNLGVGTSSPSAALHLNSGSFQIGATKIADGGGSYYA